MRLTGAGPHPGVRSKKNCRAAGRILAYFSDHSLVLLSQYSRYYSPMPAIHSAAIIGPVVWGSVWGHGPELARFLAGRVSVDYYDPLVPAEAAAPSFKAAGAYPEIDGVRVVRRRSRRKLGLLYGLEMEWKNLRAACHSNADCLVTYYPLGSVLALLWCRAKRKRSLFVFADQPEILGSRLARFLARRIFLRLTARLASAGCLATSHLLYEEISKLSPSALLVPNGVDLKNLPQVSGPAEKYERFSAGFVGFFGEWVDFELLFRAAGLCPEIEFRIIGDGPRRAELQKKAQGLANVIFTGPLPHEEVFRRIAGMQVCLIPFKVNALTDRVSPVKLFEYWAMGKPVLATGCYELRQTARSAPGEALSLVGNAEDLAAGLRALRDNPGRLQEASTMAREAVREYDWEKLGRRIAQFIEGEAASARIKSN